MHVEKKMTKLIVGVTVLSLVICPVKMASAESGVTFEIRHNFKKKTGVNWLDATAQEKAQFMVEYKKDKRRQLRDERRRKVKEYREKRKKTRTLAKKKRRIIKRKQKIARDERQVTREKARERRDVKKSIEDMKRDFRRKKKN